MMRSPSRNRSVSCTRSLLAGDSPEHGTDRHAKATEISLAENIACHHFAGSKDVARRTPVAHYDLGRAIPAHSQVREGDSRTQRVAQKRRCVEPLRPMCLGGREIARTAIIEHQRIESSGHDSTVEAIDSRLK